MPILDFKPHFLQVYIEVKGYEDENGDYHKGTGEWKDLAKCNAVPSGKANTIALPDGSTYVYSYTVHLPKDVRNFEYGEKIRIQFEDVTREFTVRGFHRYQHQCKIWV